MHKKKHLFEFCAVMPSLVSLAAPCLQVEAAQVAHAAATAAAAGAEERACEAELKLRAAAAALEAEQEEAERARRQARQAEVRQGHETHARWVIKHTQVGL